MATYSLVCGMWEVVQHNKIVDRFFSQAYADRLTRKLNQGIN